MITNIAIAAVFAGILVLLLIRMVRRHRANIQSHNDFMRDLLGDD